jgi:glutathione synthase/RimK-type ligase-like ATP-grasp enzyme/Flp pilus assembly protein TadD
MLTLDTAGIAAPQDASAHLDEVAARLLAQTQALLAAGRTDEAIKPLQQATVVRPLEPGLYEILAKVMQAAGHEADATAARMAARAIRERAAGDLIAIGTSYARHKQWDAAGYWFLRAVLLDPDMADAHLHMGIALHELGRDDESEICARNACMRQSIFIDQVWPMQRRSVLVLCTSGHDNVPLQFLMPTPFSRQIRWTIEFGLVGSVRELPPYDLVFNAIGDADRAPRGLEAAARFAPQAGKPVLNAPDRILRTSRDQIPALLADLEGVHMPPTVRWDPGAGMGLAEAIAAAGLQYPVTVRPVGKHGGAGLRRLDAPQDVEEAGRDQKNEMYLSRYCDYRGADGYFRKYRVVFVDREPLPYHLAVGENWVLHYVTADMRSHAWKTGEERRFLDDPQAALGAAAWAAVREIGRRLDLDYCGVDFSLLPDGRVLVFEANATMLVHPESGEDEVLRFKNPYVQRIFDAFETMLARRMA